jgi:hypothetical protein
LYQGLGFGGRVVVAVAVAVAVAVVVVVVVECYCFLINIIVERPPNRDPLTFTSQK